MLFDFGQPLDGTVQLAYTVPDLDAATEEFSRLGFREWTLLRDFAGEDPRYRGEPSAYRAHIAMAFCGSILVELIQPANREPSVHWDAIDRTGYGFHHFGVATTTFDTDVEDMRARGLEPLYTDRVGPSGRVAYFDTRDTLPGMTELIETGAGVNAIFTGMYLAAAQSRRE